MRMNKKTLALILTGLMSNNAFAALVEKSDLVVDQIQIGKMDGDTEPSQYSIMFNFHNSGDDINKWQIGFYMPRSFYSLAAQNINPALEMQVCNADGGCANLHYIKATFNMPDQSQGYFTMLEPISNFPLKEKGRYYIRLAHSNQWPAGNVSALPQNLFLISDNYSKNGVPRIHTISTELTQYSLLGYDHNQVETQIKDKLTANWQNSQSFTAASLPGVVPQPVTIKALANDGFTRPKQLTIHNQLNDNNSVASLWAQKIKSDWKQKKPVLIDNNSAANTGIIITEISDPKSIANSPEGYRLTINTDNITIETLTQTGAYYALQTLRQIWAQNKQTLPSVTVTDYPRFKYRGVLLDTARHYFSIAEIKTLLDVMASQKLNTLHIHFADDEAFRLGLESYPNLTATAANRGLGLAVGPNMLPQNNLDTTNLTQQAYSLANSAYNGSYSAEDVKTLISYANANQITIIPEIDLPGHARALIKALPDVMVDPNDNSQFVSVQGYSDDVLPVCTYGTDISVGNQFTPTINTIMQNVAAQFNNQSTVYAVNNEVSVGGDEVSSHAWTNDTSCRNEWGNLSALEKSHLFFQKLANSNSELMFSGWQQFIQNDSESLGKNIVAANQTGHVWVWNPSSEGVKQAASLANNNYPTVLSYADKTYFDLAYTPSMYEPGFTWATGYSDTYSSLSMAETASKTQSKTKNPQNIVGIEGTLWSENLPSFDHLMYMALPKMPGLAEAGWSPNWVTINNKQLDWQSLATRLGCGETGFLAYLHQSFAVNYRGYPHGISRELPDDNSLCSTSSSTAN